MTTDPTTNRPLQDRVARLEVDVRRIGQFAMGAAIIIGVALGWGLWARRDVSARRIAPVDREGSPRLRLEVGEAGEVVVMMLEGATVKGRGTIWAGDGKLEVEAKAP